MVETAKWILIGLREWDVPSEKSSTISKGKHKIQQCDLLEVYSDIDKLRLRESVPEDWNILDSNDVSKIDLGLGNDTGNDFIFGTDRDFERDRLIQEMQSSTAERITLQVGESKEGDVVAPTEEEINIDDI
jgi:hypothetical protein